jgi:AcrR family transcriptional regulator
MLATEVAENQSSRIHRAMIEMVAEQGFGAVKVRELVLLAGVSSRAFYENFASKEDCFIRTYEMVTRQASRRIIASQVGERDWRERPRLIFAGFLEELENDPDAARLALIEAHAAGPVGLESVRRAESTFLAMVGESFARAPNGIAVSPLVIEGMVAGVGAVSRARLLAGHEAQLPDLASELMEWALCYPHASAGQLIDLDGVSVWRNTMLEPLIIPSSMGEGRVWPPTGDRALILVSIAQLAAANGYANLTVPRIRKNAGVSRTVFASHFEGIEDCFVAALEQGTGEVVAQVVRAQAAGRTWSGGVYRGIAALCDQIATDPILASVCFADDFAQHSNGGRYRQRMIATIAEQFAYGGPLELALGPVATEASTGAIWTIFNHHIVRDWAQRQKVAATLTYMALAPVVGASTAVAAIRSEQMA